MWIFFTDGLTLDHGDISPPGNTFSEWKEFTLKLIVIICVVILALVYFVVKHGENILYKY